MFIEYSILPPPTLIHDSKMYLYNIGILLDLRWAMTTKYLIKYQGISNGILGISSLYIIESNCMQKFKSVFDIIFIYYTE